MTELWICRHNGLSSEQERTQARKLLKAALVERIPHCSEQLRFEYGKYGKPYLKNAALQFSLSYTHGAYIIALSDDEIGADIELLRTAKPHVANRCFTEIWSCLINDFTSCGHKRRRILNTRGRGFIAHRKALMF